MRVCRAFSGCVQCTDMEGRDGQAWVVSLSPCFLFFSVGREDLSICIYDLYKKKEFCPGCSVFPFAFFRSRGFPSRLGAVGRDWSTEWKCARRLCTCFGVETDQVTMGFQAREEGASSTVVWRSDR